MDKRQTKSSSEPSCRPSRIHTRRNGVEVLTLSSGRGTQVDLLLYADLNRHHELWGGTQAFGEAGRTDEAEPIVDFMQENALTSLLPSERVI
jgi:hypothetical protein